MQHHPSVSLLHRLSRPARLVGAARSLLKIGQRPAKSRLLGLVTASTLLALPVATNAGTLYLSRLSGANENPPTTSTATGIGVLILNDDETQATITATHDISIPLTGGHIHRAPITANGPVIFPFPAPASPVGPLTWNIPAAEVVNLKTLGLYMNFHTAVNPGGAIRGQLVRALLAPAATTVAQTRIANALDVSAGFDSDLNQILIQTNLAAAAVQTQTLNDLSARTVHAPAREEIETMASLTDSLFALADDARSGPVTVVGQVAAFFRGGAEFGERPDSANQAGATISRSVFVGGIDYRFNEASRGGLAVGYADGQDKFDNGLGKTTTKTTAFHAFLSTKLGDSGVALDGAVGYGWGKIDSSRNITSLGRNAVASPDGTVWSAALKASKAITLNNQTTIIPYVLIDAQEASIDAYSETGAGAAGLVIPKLSSWNSAIEGGATLLVPIKVQSGALTLRLQAGWHYLFEDGADTFATRLTGSPVVFVTAIDGAEKSAAHGEASLTATMKNGLQATLGYRGLLSSGGQTNHAVEARIVIKL